MEKNDTCKISKVMHGPILQLTIHTVRQYLYLNMYVCFGSKIYGTFKIWTKASCSKDLNGLACDLFVGSARKRIYF